MYLEKDVETEKSGCDHDWTIVIGIQYLPWMEMIDVGNKDLPNMVMTRRLPNRLFCPICCEFKHVQ